MAQDKGYKIGAVSKSTGIPPETLRIWEHRYGIVRPARGPSGARVYSDKDIEHLSLLRQLLANGDSIGNLVDLSMGELRKRLGKYSKLHSSTGPIVTSSGTITICVLGPTLPILLENHENEKGPVSFSGLYTTDTEFESQVQQASPDLLILEYPNIHEEDLKSIRGKFRFSNAKQLLIVYRYSNSTLLDKLKKEGILVVRGPVDYYELLNLCHVPLPSNTDNKSSNLPSHTNRLFSDHELSKISMVQTIVNCECPHHIAQILTGLVAFETYSKDCEDRNAEDAALHAELYDTTVNARSSFESVLKKILLAENINIDSL